MTFATIKQMIVTLVGASCYMSEEYDSGDNQPYGNIFHPINILYLHLRSVGTFSLRSITFRYELLSVCSTTMLTNVFDLCFWGAILLRRAKQHKPHLMLNHDFDYND